MNLRRPGTTAEGHVLNIDDHKPMVVDLLARQTDASSSSCVFVDGINTPLHRHCGRCVDQIHRSRCGLVDIFDEP